MSDLERILEIKNVLDFCHLLAENPEAITQNAFLEEFLTICYNSTAGCKCRHRNQIKPLEEKFLQLNEQLNDESKKILGSIFGEAYNQVYLILSNEEKIQLK